MNTSSDQGMRVRVLQDTPDVEECGTTETVVTPLVGTMDEGTDEAADDGDDGHEESGQDVRGGQTGDKQHFKQTQGTGNNPLDVADILQADGSAKDLT